MMSLFPLPIFTDNYVWICRFEETRRAVIVDPGESAPVETYLAEQGLTLAGILITHHHADHIGGVGALLQRWSVPVFGPASTRIPQVTCPVADGSIVQLEGLQWRVLEVPGHTREHVAYFSPTADGGPLLFCGDTLFAAGCGRMFEGTAPQMQASLARLARLPHETRVCCTHEYTLSNLKFAQVVLGEQQSLQQRLAKESAKRSVGVPTLPSTIGEELATNPFLRWQDPVVVQSLQKVGRYAGGEAAQVFGALRAWKDEFR
ncbi:MAG: hydroxyacylglutathione hydrolase [Pseudohongiellaceae bacterium]|jgi:hydroxyacylglutathione hydrolase